MNDMNLEEFLGLEPEDADPADTEGAEEQDTDAEPADSYEDEGENEQDTDAEPAEDQGKKPMTPEERHANAARRRAAELDAVRQEERQKAKAEMDAYIKSLGLKNSYDGNKPIETKEEYDAYQRAKQNKALERGLSGGKLTVEQFNEAVDARIAARQSAPDKPAQAAPAPAQATPAQPAQPNREEVDKQYAQIQAMDPDAPSLAELAQDQTYLDAVKQTGSMVRAYVERLKNVSAQAGRMDAQVRAQSKAHLQRTGGRGGDSIVVTQEMRDMYRVFEPDISDDDIRKQEAKYASQLNKQRR